MSVIPTYPMPISMVLIARFNKPCFRNISNTAMTININKLIFVTNIIQLMSFWNFNISTRVSTIRNYGIMKALVNTFVKYFNNLLSFSPYNFYRPFLSQ